MQKFSLFTFLLSLLSISTVIQAQSDRWQQAVDYKMDIDFEAKKHQLTGKQTLIYYNNSPDQLDRVFYHLYFNAFQPGSMMDVRSNTIADADPRVGDRISHLEKDEIGYQKIRVLKQNGKELKYEVVGTILEVQLAEPILPGSKTEFYMEFEAQVPVQIRRSGRDNAEGIAYSMAQWYPKMCEYDYQGWHANPYVGREFYGVWGNFDVSITIDRDFTIGATGYLQNPDEIGHGFARKDSNPPKSKGKKLTWHFVAPEVHDFVWAADQDYTHDTFTRKDGLVLHFFYQKNEATEESWAALPAVMDKAFDYINEHFGQYPYKQYSFIQGGDGGMEYPMATLITGERGLGSLVGVSVHELLHSWYQMVLGTNESLYPWMDEGFTSYASTRVMNHLKGLGVVPGKEVENPFIGTYNGYVGFSKSGIEEPMIMHSDHYNTNAAYSVASYVKGSIFLAQLEYVIGKKAFDAGLLNYFNTWKFKHPNANDFIRIMEKESGLELDWYREYFVNTIRTIDYGVKTVEANGQKTTVTLEKIGLMPMPLDVLVSYQDGTSELLNIPLEIMRGAKPSPDSSIKYTVLKDWPWTNPTYQFTLDKNKDQIVKIIIDPKGGMADVAPENNSYSGTN